MKLIVTGVGLGLLLAAAPGQAQERELMLADGQRVFIDHGCFGCHAVAGSGGASGPDLSHVGTRYDQDALAAFFRDPAHQGLPAHAQTFQRLSRGQVERLAAYLSSLR